MSAERSATVTKKVLLSKKRVRQLLLAEARLPERGTSILYGVQGRQALDALEDALEFVELTYSEDVSREHFAPLVEAVDPRDTKLSDVETALRSFRTGGIDSNALVEALEEVLRR